MISWFTSAQITQPTIPVDGINYYMDTRGVFLNASTTGPWDFSSVNPDDSREIAIQPIEDSPYATEYPNSTHAYYEDGFVQFPGYTSTEYTYNGEQSFLLSNYPTPLVIHPYPFNVGDVHTDGIFNVPFEVPGGPPSLFRDHEVESEAMDTSSITLPDGTVFNDVTLVISTATFTDAQTGSSPCITVIETWSWWAPGIAVPVAQTFDQLSGGQCPPNPFQFSRFYTGEGPFAYVCTPALNCSFGDGFRLVNIEEIDNSSACEGYGDFTNLVANLEADTTYDLTVTTGWGDQNVTVWIDFNDDSQFTNDEKVVQNFVIAPGQNGGTFTETVDLAIPANAPTGNHRMRLKSNWQAAVPDDACEVTDFGETEDYTVAIEEVLSISDQEFQNAELVVVSLGDNRFELSLNTLSGVKLSAALFNMIGQKLSHESLNRGNNGTYQSTIDLSQFASGIYLIKVSSQASNTVKTAKVIVR
ncbi:MAG: GEVED domain-containing protein [Flavobacteriaceae bacterium]|nr:GEVED domain-containing protein [Flavobacteriaceae bacterium]MDG1961953.1 GEVED domain-containing protein [Flavobacteriaceae bacterium]